VGCDLGDAEDADEREDVSEEHFTDAETRE
jgi:hypothetical protein